MTEKICPKCGEKMFQETFETGWRNEFGCDLYNIAWICPKCDYGWK